MERQIALLSALLGSSVWLVYWTGRWYKERFFDQFDIPYDLLSLDYHYYLFGSWATMLVAVSGIAIALNLVLTVGVTGFHRDRHTVASLSMVGAVAASLALRPSFDPTGHALKQLFASPDALVNLFGGVATALTCWLIYRRPEDVDRAMKRTVRVGLRFAFPLFVGALLVAWPYLLTVGTLMGRYHGRAAIWEGKMGLRWVRVDGAWWIFVVRTSDGRVFIYDRDKKKARIVGDWAIQEIDGRVSKAPPPKP